MKNCLGLSPPRRVLAGMLLLSVIPVVTSLAYPHVYLGDDALITLTFVKNLVRGNGWVFNHPPPVLSTTTPLFTLVITGGALIFPGVAVTRLAVLFSGGCWLAVIWVFFWARRTLGLDDLLVLLIGFFLVLFSWPRLLGMEMYLFILLLMVVLVFYLQGRYLLSGLLCGLLFLTRGEGILLLGLLGGMQIAGRLASGRKKRGVPDTPDLKSLICLAGGFLFPLAAWTLFAWPRFGNIFPDTLGAKVAQGQSGIWPLFFPRLITEWMPHWSARLSWLGIDEISLWYPLILLGIYSLLKSYRKLLPLPLWGLLYVLGYTILGVAGYSWYGFLVHFTMVILFALGLFQVCQWIRLTRLRASGRVLLSALLILAALGPKIPSRIRGVLRPPVPAKCPVYHDFSRWIGERAGDHRTIAYFEIGYLGYYTDNRILDLVGLTDPAVLPHVANGNFSWGFWRARPDFLVYKKGSYFQPYVRDDPRFGNLYRLLRKFADTAGEEYWIFERIR